MGIYQRDHSRPVKRGGKIKKLIVFALFIILASGGYLIWKQFYNNGPVSPEKLAKSINFDAGFSETEKTQVLNAFSEQAIDFKGDVNSKVESKTDLVDVKIANVIQAYVPVTSFNSTKQKILLSEISNLKVGFLQETEQAIKDSITAELSIASPVLDIKSFDSINEDEIIFIPANRLTGEVKLLALNDKYYLDTFDSGAVFRVASFELAGEGDLSLLRLSNLSNKENIFKVNMSGVTALTREMMKTLPAKGPTFFSAKIGEFLADADLTHVSNEVSFKESCGYSRTLFCSPPEFIETLKSSGVDLVEITGNHNNDLGSEYNTSTIELYKSLGWATVGGGLNNIQAAKPYLSDQKSSKVTFLAYNFPDSPNGGAISGVDKAGANSFDFARIESEIAAAKLVSQFVVVNIQYWECYSYPDGYIEFPECDKPIGEQEVNFKKVVDLGADMVIGSSAHQPQTYELYKGKPIYYGLGNLYFEQTQWPGTERGIILTHYFSEGKLMQTKLTPTVYGKDFQTRVMTDEESAYLLRRLRDAR